MPLSACKKHVDKQTVTLSTRPSLVKISQTGYTEICIDAGSVVKSSNWRSDTQKVFASFFKKKRFLALF
jgi:hypothetical protein